MERRQRQSLVDEAPGCVGLVRRLYSSPDVVTLLSAWVAVTIRCKPLRGCGGPFLPSSTVCPQTPSSNDAKLPKTAEADMFPARSPSRRRSPIDLLRSKPFSLLRG